MKADARRIGAALDRPAPDIRLYLLHGPDEAAAAELAGRLGQAMGSGAERVDLDGATLRSDPARLVDEAAALSLFGTARYVRVSGVGEESVSAIEALLATTVAGNPVVALAPGVKTTGKLVKLAVESPQALAHGCYVPSGAEAGRLVTSVARDHGLRISPAAAIRLAEAAAGDRAVITREIEKFALYLDAEVDRPATLDDAVLDAVGADLGEHEVARAVAALINGDAAVLALELTRLAEAGTSPILWLRQITRRLIALADMRGSLDRGDRLDAVLMQHRVFRREEESTARALRRWTGSMLSEAIARLRAAERAVMAPGNAGHVLAERSALDLARRVAQR